MEMDTDSCNSGTLHDGYWGQAWHRGEGLLGELLSFKWMVVTNRWGQTLWPCKPKSSHVKGMQNHNNWSWDSQQILPVFLGKCICVPYLFWFKKINVKSLIIWESQSNWYCRFILAPFHFSHLVQAVGSQTGYDRLVESGQKGAWNSYYPTQTFPSPLTRSSPYISVMCTCSLLICMWSLFPNQALGFS